MIRPQSVRFPPTGQEKAPNLSGQNPRAVRQPPPRGQDDPYNHLF